MPLLRGAEGPLLTCGIMSNSESNADAGMYRHGYFETRLAPNQNRVAVWKHMCHYLARWVAPDDDVLELGAGWCDFANQVTAGRVVAMDIDEVVIVPPPTTSTPVVGDCTDLSAGSTTPASTWSSPPTCSSTSSDLLPPAAGRGRRVLRARWPADPDAAELPAEPGSLLRRLHPRGDLHRPVAAATTSSPRAGRSSRSLPRFLPLTMKSRGAGLTFLVPWYLKSPVKPLAGQMLVVGTP